VRTKEGKAFTWAINWYRGAYGLFTRVANPFIIYSDLDPAFPYSFGSGN
jgi:hypothetical protein